MKTITLSLLSMLCVSILPTTLSAQPTITTNEFYYIGDVIQMVNCNPDAFNAGVSGSDVTWDFSGLTPTGGMSVTTVVHDTSSVFTTCNLLITLPNGFKEHMLENNSDSYVKGIVDTNSGVTTQYYNYDIAKRPITYLTNYVDSYQVVITSSNLAGKGYLTTTVDGYGNLVLPVGTYNNVLRVKQLQTETDTTGGSTITYSTKVSYLWFDGTHSAPLLRIDSVIGIVGAGNTIMYLAASTGVNTLNSTQSSYQCAIQDNTLCLTGAFDYGKIYEVTVYNIIGAKIYTTEFTGDVNNIRFDMGRDINPGIYIVSITQKNDPGSRETIKVVKQ